MRPCFLIKRQPKAATRGHWALVRHNHCQLMMTSDDDDDDDDDDSDYNGKSPRRPQVIKVLVRHNYCHDQHCHCDVIIADIIISIIAIFSIIAIARRVQAAGQTQPLPTPPCHDHLDVLIKRMRLAMIVNWGVEVAYWQSRSKAAAWLSAKLITILMQRRLLVLGQGLTSVSDLLFLAGRQEVFWPRGQPHLSTKTWVNTGRLSLMLYEKIKSWVPWYICILRYVLFSDISTLKSKQKGINIFVLNIYCVEGAFHVITRL